MNKQDLRLETGNEEVDGVKQREENAEHGKRIFLRGTAHKIDNLHTLNLVSIRSQWKAEVVLPGKKHCRSDLIIQNLKEFS